MGKVVVEISMSLDGFVAGPNATLEEPLGEGGEQLRERVIGLSSWRASHGLEGGEDNADSARLAESVTSSGAVLMGRRMFSGGSGPWADDPNPGGWWGDDPPFRKPVFVLTHHERDPLELGDTTFTFVTDGVESAVEQARTAAGGKDVHVAGGARVTQEVLNAGLLDEIQLHVVPLLLGGGTRLFEDVRSDVRLEPADVLASPGVTHVRYRVFRS